MEFLKTFTRKKQEKYPEYVDIIFVNFIQPSILLVLKYLDLKYDVVNIVNAYMKRMGIVFLIAQ